MILLRPEVVAARLRDLGIANPQQIELAKQELPHSQERFSQILVRQGVLRDPDVAKRLAAQLGSIPQRLDPAATASLPAAPTLALWHVHHVVPIQDTGDRLLVATDDPLSVFALEFLGGQCGRPLDGVLIREQDLAPLLTQLDRPAAGASSGPVAPSRPSVSPSAPAPAPSIHPAMPAPPMSQVAPPRESRVPPPASAPAPLRGGSSPRSSTPAGTSSAATNGDEPIIQLVNSMLSEAVRMRASDVHIESATDQVRVRYRIDGVLHDVNTPPKALQGPIISRIKIMGNLNIAEKRLPQDGRLQLVVEHRPLDVRISILPSTHGESIVMRLLDRSQPIRGLQEMGLLPEDQRTWESLIERPHGMVLVTGPTGSGKTTTLYGAMAMLNQPDRKLITVEDPVEYQLAGVNQVSVKATIGLTFAAGLRAMLRQAPDVIMVGEIRDRETAQIAIQAALTGHLVLSTLHTNDAPSAITRLIDMGIPAFLVASTLQGVLAQRLVRRICPGCRMTDHATNEERQFLGPPDAQQLIRSTGCDKCHRSGYFGRVGLFELLVMSPAIHQLILSKPAASVIRTTATQAGMRGLRQDGCAKIREGLTTMTEVLRVVASTDGS